MIMNASAVLHGSEWQHIHGTT